MKTEPLLQIKADVLAHPRQFQMLSLFSPSLDDLSTNAGGCGTAACICGWYWHRKLQSQELVYTERKVEHTGNVMKIAVAELQLPNDSLFHIDHWPSPFESAYENAIAQQNFPEAARIVGQVIDDYIATNGWQ